MLHLFFPLGKSRHLCRCKLSRHGKRERERRGQKEKEEEGAEGPCKANVMNEEE